MDKSYQKAKEEWSDRLGNGKAQAAHWKWACFLSFLMVILLLVAIVVILKAQKTYVYVAEVKPGENLVKVQSAEMAYQPSVVQQEYFVGQFIRAIMSVSLDPVVVRQSWLKAYRFVEGQAVEQLNAYAIKNNPLSQVGLMTKVVKIQDFHPIGKNSFSFTWTQTTYDAKGVKQNVLLYNGIFTLGASKLPQNGEALLENPLGLKIAYFTFSLQGRS